MSKENYFSISGAIFLAIAILHAARLFYGWSAVVYGWTVPDSVSWIALVVAGYLGYQGLILGKK